MPDFRGNSSGRVDEQPCRVAALQWFSTEDKARRGELLYLGIPNCAFSCYLKVLYGIPRLVPHWASTEFVQAGRRCPPLSIRSEGSVLSEVLCVRVCVSSLPQCSPV